MKLVCTDDGSSTIVGLESYHSMYGAYSESMHVFIQHGLLAQDRQQPLRILEVGFGTGLNAILTWKHQPKDIPVHYIAVEPNPVPMEILDQCRVPQVSSKWMDRFMMLHGLSWDVSHQLSAHFSIHKMCMGVELMVLDHPVDVIYFDAFSPDVQQNIWSEAVMQMCYRWLNDSGVLVTYCAKGMVKQRLRDVGFLVKRLPGPPGKRHIIQAIKDKE